MIVSCEDLSVRLGGRDVLEHVSFQVEKGEYLCIVGENGSGKSTLIRALLGLVPLKGGRVTIAPSAGRVGYLPQQNRQGSFPASVHEVVLSGCLNRRGTRPFLSQRDKDEARENEERLGILELAKRRYSDLSGGQKQRVLLARALCACENLLLLDEPVTGLDPVVTEELYGVLRTLNKEKGLTVLTVSHDIRTATSFANHVLHLDRTVRFLGPTEEYLQSELGIHFTGRCCEHV